MKYDPIKRTLGKVFNQSTFLRIVFYKMLDILLLRSWHVRKELRKWSKTAPINSKILDAGSGFGQYDYFISSIGKKFELLGVDVKTEQIEDCNRFFKSIGRDHKVRFEIADLTQFSKPDLFDLILSVDVMEHILEDVAVFKNCYNSLSSTGRLLVSTPADQGGSDAHHEHDHDDVSGFIDEHVRDGYNISEIEEKIKSVGFSRVEAAYTYGNAGSAAWRLSMKYPIQMLNITKLFFILLPFYYIVTFPFILILNFIDLYKKHKKGTGLIVKAWK